MWKTRKSYGGLIGHEEIEYWQNLGTFKVGHNNFTGLFFYEKIENVEKLGKLVRQENVRQYWWNLKNSGKLKLMLQRNWSVKKKSGYWRILSQEIVEYCCIVTVSLESDASNLPLKTFNCA